MNNLKKTWNNCKYALIAPIAALSLEAGVVGVEYIRESPKPFVTANIPFEMLYTDSFKYPKNWKLEEYVKQFEYKQGNIIRIKEASQEH